MIEKWITDRRLLWERRFDRLGEMLAEPDEEWMRGPSPARPVLTVPLEEAITCEK